MQDSFSSEQQQIRPSLSPTKLSTVLGDITNLSDSNLLASKCSLSPGDSQINRRDSGYNRLLHNINTHKDNFREQKHNLYQSHELDANKESPKFKDGDNTFQSKYLPKSNLNFLDVQHLDSYESTQNDQTCKSARSVRPVSVLSSRSNMTTEDKDKVIDALRRELNHNTKEIKKIQMQQEKEKKNIVQSFEKQIQESRKDSQDRVQKAYERRGKLQRNTEKIGNSKGEDTHASMASSKSTHALSARGVMQSLMPLANHSRLTSQGQIKPIQLNKHKMNQRQTSAKLTDYLDQFKTDNEMTFNAKAKEETQQFISNENKANEIRKTIQDEYELRLQIRCQEMKVDLQKKLREDLAQELRIENIATMKQQREVIRKEVRNELNKEFEAKLEKEVERRMQGDFLDWEEDYKKRKIATFQQQVEGDLKREFQFKLEERVEQERAKMEEQCSETINENIRVAREESDIAIQEQIEILQQQTDRQIENEKMIIRAECLEELRGEREMEMQKKLREKLTKKIQDELYNELPSQIEPKIKQQITEQLLKQIKISNDKELDQAKRKIQIQREDKEFELKQRMKCDFDFEVRKTAEELSAKREKEIVKKYKQMYERERRDMTEKLNKEFEIRLEEIKKDQSQEKAEIARLKSLEHIRLKKLGQSRKDMEEQIRLEKIDLERQRAALEYEARERRVREMVAEDKRNKVSKNAGGLSESAVPPKMLGNDEGTKGLCKGIKGQKSQSTFKQFDPMSALSSENTLDRIISNQKVLPQQTKHKFVQIPSLSFHNIPGTSVKSPNNDYSQALSPALINLKPFEISKESTFNPHTQSLPPAFGGAAPENTESSYATEEDNQNERFDLKTQQFKQYIKPYDSRGLVKQLLKDSVQKYQIKSRLAPMTLIDASSQGTTGRSYGASLSNKENVQISNYDQLLRGRGQQSASSNKPQNQVTSYTLSFPLASGHKMNPIEFKMVFKSYIEKEVLAEKEFDLKKQIIIANLEYTLSGNGMSDHGMFDYLLDLWEILMVSYQSRLAFLQSLQLREAKSIYCNLEQETTILADFKNDSLDIFKLIKRKEDKFGNFMGTKYSKVEHSSDLFSLRADIVKKIEEYRRRQKKVGKAFDDILWKGVSYLDICRMEKLEVESSMKDQIREELEQKKFNRGGSTYSKLI